LVEWEDMPRWRIIDKTLGLDMAEPPETYHTSPHLFTDLDIPAGATGTLPKADRTRAGLGAEVEEDLGGGRRKGRTRATTVERPAATRTPRRRRRRTGEGDDTATAAPAAPAVSTEDAPVRSRSRRRSAEARPSEAPSTELRFTAARSTEDSEAPGAAPARRRRRRRPASPAGE
jgi:hypothetical protein